MSIKPLVVAVGLALAVPVYAQSPAPHADRFPAHGSDKIQLKKTRVQLAKTAPATKQPTGENASSGQGREIPSRVKPSQSASAKTAGTPRFSMLAAAASCTVEQLSSLSGTALVSAVKAADDTCRRSFYSTTDAQAKAMFGEAKMITIANAIASIGASYDGSNSSGILGLVYYLRAGYWRQWGNEALIGSYGPNLKAASHGALTAFFASPGAFRADTVNGEILSEFFILADSADDEPAMMPQAKYMLSVVNANPKLWLSDYYMGSAANNALGVYFSLSYNSAADATLAADPSLASALLTFYNANKALIGGVDNQGYSTTWFIKNVLTEYARLLQYGSQKATVSPNLASALRALDKNNAEQFKVWAGVADMANYYDGGNCASYGTCNAAEEVKNRVLGVRYTCPSANWLRFLAQNMSQTELDASCASVAAEFNLFHSINGTSAGAPIPGDINDTIEMNIFDSSNEYGSWAGTIFGISTDNGGMYLEGSEPENAAAHCNGGNAATCNQARFIAYEAEWLRPQFYIWNLSHEFVHYLDGRWNTKGNYNDGYGHLTVWWAEGLAEYIAYTHENKRNDAAWNVMAAKNYALSFIFRTPTSPWDTDRVYRGGYVAQKFLIERHPEIFQRLRGYLRAGDYAGYDNYLLNTLGTSLDAEFAAWWPTAANGTTPPTNHAPLINSISANPATLLSGDSGSVSVGASDADNDVLSYSWSASPALSLSNANQATASFVAPTVTTDTLYTLTASVSDGGASPVTRTVQITVKPKVSQTTCPVAGRLDNHCTIANLAGATGARVYAAALWVPAGAKNLKVTTNGGGNADLYVGVGFWPSETSYHYQSVNAGSAESFTQAAPYTGQWYYFTLYGRSAFSGVSITASYN